MEKEEKRGMKRYAEGYIQEWRVGDLEFYGETAPLCRYATCYGHSSKYIHSFFRLYKRLNDAGFVVNYRRGPCPSTWGGYFYIPKNSK